MRRWREISAIGLAAALAFLAAARAQTNHFDAAAGKNAAGKSSTFDPHDLTGIWNPAPFLISAVAVSVACAIPIAFVREVGGEERVFEGVGTYLRHSWRVFTANANVRRFLIANAAWEGTFAGARSFVVLYITVGLGEASSVSTAVFGPVGAGYIVAAAVAGRVGDRFGLARVIWTASIVYGVGLLGGGLARSWHYWYLGIVFVVSVAAGAVMTLAWGLLFKLMPAADRGAISGLATTTKGLGLFVGVPLTGLAIDLLKPHLESTNGFQALWPLLGVPILAVIPLVKSLEKVEADADRRGVGKGDDVVQIQPVS